MKLNVYLSGEIHSDWREQIIPVLYGSNSRAFLEIRCHFMK